MPLRDMNLNALVALEALLRCSSVTAAARDIGISQSAMSHQLALLRTRFADPLLVRSGAGMQPTPRAQRLTRPLQQALQNLAQVVRDHADFEPTQAQQNFRISAGQHIALALMPALSRTLSRVSSGISVECREVPRTRYAEALEQGSTDLVLGVGDPHNAALMTRPWLHDEFCCVHGPSHPLASTALDLDSYCAYPHLVVSPTGLGKSPVDKALADLQRARTVQLRVDSFLLAPNIVRETELLLTAPRAALTSYIDEGLVMEQPLPIELPKSTPVALIWHEGRNQDPALQWFRDQVWNLRPLGRA